MILMKVEKHNIAEHSVSKPALLGSDKLVLRSLYNHGDLGIGCYH